MNRFSPRSYEAVGKSPAGVTPFLVTPSGLQENFTVNGLFRSGWKRIGSPSSIFQAAHSQQENGGGE